MAARPGSGRVGALAAALAVLTAAPALPAAVGAASAPRAAAQPLVVRPPLAPPPPGVGPVDIDLTRVTPTVLTARGTVTISGVVRNTGSTPVPLGTLRLRLGERAVETGEQVTAWAASTDSSPGPVIAEQPAAATLAAGAALPFRLTVPDPRRWSRQPYGVLPVSIETGGAARHTFLGFQKIKQYEPLRLTWVVPLTLGPDPELWGADAAGRTRAWTHAVGPGSRLERLLAATGGLPGVTWAVDPVLVLPPAVPAPPRVGASPAPTPAATTTTSPYAASAPEADVRAAAAARVTRALRGRSPIVLPLGDADVAAATQDQSARDAVHGLVRRAGAAADLVEGRTDVALPVDGQWSEARGSAYRQMYAGRLAGVVLPSSAFAWSRDTLSASRRSVDGVPLVATNRRLDALVSPGARARTSAEATQELLAQSLVTLQLSPGRERDVVVAAPRDLVPEGRALRDFITAADTIPWLRPQPTDVVLRAAAESAPVVVGATPTPAEPSAPVVTPKAARRLGDLATQAAAGAAIREDGAAVVSRWDAALTALYSVAWRGHAEQWRGLEGRVAAEVRATSDAVHVEPQTITFLADRGRIQVTVVNRLGVQVDGVRVHLVPANPRVRIDSEPTPIRIGAGSRTTVGVDVTALAAGQVTVLASVVGPTGVPVGPATAVQVSVSPTGSWIYTVLGALALAFLGAGLWRNRRAAHRERPVANAVLDEPDLDGRPDVDSDDETIGEAELGSDVGVEAVPLTSDPPGVDPPEGAPPVPSDHPYRHESAP